MQPYAPVYVTVAFRLMTAQRAGQGQTCEGGEADFDEGSTAAGVEQRSAAARRHLAQETAAPGDQCHPISFPSASLTTHSLPSQLDKPLLPLLRLYSLSRCAHSVSPAGTAQRLRLLCPSATLISFPSICLRLSF